MVFPLVGGINMSSGVVGLIHSARMADWEEWRNNKQPSFSPLMFVISAEGGGDEQLSEAGIQLKYASGVAGHNRRLRRRNDKGYALGFND